MDDNAFSDEKGSSGNTILTFPWWQEGLFAVLYLMNSGESTRSSGPVDAATQNTYEVVSIFLELIQTLPFLLPNYQLYHCTGELDMNAGCILKTISQFWLPANGTDFDTFFGIMLTLSCIIFAMGAVVFVIASTFHKKDVRFVWPVVFLRGCVGILATTYLVSIAQSLMVVFSCPMLEERYITSGFTCHSGMHAFLMAACALALAILVPFAIVIGLLYNTMDVTGRDPGVSAHGRSKLLAVITKLVIPAAYVIAVSADNQAAYIICQIASIISLVIYATSRVVCAARIVDWANSARTALSCVYLAVCITGFSKTNDTLMVSLIALVGACVGLVAAGWRKYQIIQWARHRFYAVKPRVSDTYAAHLVEMLFEECQNMRAPGGAVLDNEPTSPTSNGGESAAGGEAVYSVKDKAAVTMVRNMMWIETDIELLFRFFLEEWEAMSAEDKKVAKVAINEIFVQVFHTGMFREFALMWYAVISQKLFNDYLTSKSFLRVAFESNTSIDMSYLAYLLQKQNETARQAANWGNNATGNRFNLVDLVTFKRFAETAKRNHRKALQGIQQVLSRLIDTDLQMAQMANNGAKDEDDEEDEQKEASQGKVSASELQNNNELLKDAMNSVRQAEISYAALCKAFPKSAEARSLYLLFLRQVVPEEAPPDILNSAEANDEGIDKSDSSSSLGGRGNVLTPKQEYVRDLRTKLSSIMRFTSMTMWAGLLLMGAMMLIIAGVGNTEEEYLVDKTIENVDALNAIRTSWLGICKFSVEISHFVRVRDENRVRLSEELPPKNTQLVSLLNSVQLMNVGDNPVTAGTPDIVAAIMKSNADHENMSDGDLRGLQSDWEDQVAMLRAESRFRNVDLLSDTESLVTSNTIPRVVEMARSPVSAVLRKFHNKYKTDKAAGGGSWSCKQCNLHDLYVTDARGILVGFDLESGFKMQVATDYAVYQQVKAMEIGMNMGKASEDFDSDPVLKDRFESWDVHALLRLSHASRAHLEFFSKVKRTDDMYKQVHIEKVQHSEAKDQQLITITVPIWSKTVPTDPKLDKPIGYLTSEARVLTSEFLEEVLKIQDLVWKEVMNDLVVLARGLSKMVDEEVTHAAESGDDLKLDAFTGDHVQLTYYSGVTTADSGKPGAADARTNEAWGRSYEKVSFRKVVAEFSNAVVSSTASLQTMRAEELKKMPSYRLITEMCVRESQSYSLRLTDLTTEFADEFIAGRVVVLVVITCCVILVNLLTCGAMNYAISHRLADFEERDEMGLSIAFKLVSEIPIMSKKKMSKRFKQHLKNGLSTNADRNASRNNTRTNTLKSLTDGKVSPQREASPQTTDSPKHGDAGEAIEESPRFVHEDVQDGDGNIEKRLRHSNSGSQDGENQANFDGDNDCPTPEEVLDAAADFISDSETEQKPKQKVSKKKQQVEQDSEDSDEDAAEQRRKLKKKTSKLQPEGRVRRDESPSRKSDNASPRKVVSIADKEKSPSKRGNTIGKVDNSPVARRSSSYLVEEQEEKRSTKSPKGKKSKGSDKKALQQQQLAQQQFQMAMKSHEEKDSKAALTCGQRMERFFVGWSRGYLRRWIVILWAVLIVYSCGLLARVLMNFTDFGTFCTDLALAQKTHFYFRNACTRVMDTVVWERMPWRTDGGQTLRNDFDDALNSAELSLSTLISNKDSSKYEPRQKLLFQDYCMLGSGNCGKRVGWEAYKNPELMERGMYRAALVWIDHVRELRREYADTKLPQSYINSTHPPEFWFVRDSIAYDLAPGLFLLIETYIKEARDLLPVTAALVWAVAGGGLAVVGFVSIVCGMLMKWQWQQISDALTALRLLPWEDVQNQTILTTAQIVGDKDGPGDGQDHDDHVSNGGQVGMVPMQMGVPMQMMPGGQGYVGSPQAYKA